MKDDGLIVGREFKEIPPRVEYAVSETGKSLETVLLQIETWGKQILVGRRTKEAPSPKCQGWLLSVLAITLYIPL